jgi:hypothetical protein
LGAATGGFMIVKPEIISFTKKQVTDAVSSKVYNLKIWNLVLIFGIVCCAGFILKRVYDAFTRKKPKKEYLR